MLLQQKVFASLVPHLRATRSNPNIMPAPMDAAQLQVRRGCPSCLKQMETYPYAGPGNAVIDSCLPCGLIYLDQGELTKLAVAPGKR